MSLLSAAKAYANLGLYIFPLAPRSKKPLAGGSGLLDATIDQDQIERWWAVHPDANIGCNAGDSDLAVLDADLYKPGCEDALETLSDEIGGIPDTWTALTGGGGHQYFFCTKGIPGALSSGADCFGPGLDFKADGGYVVLPPSIHPSGKRYEWEASSTPINSELKTIPSGLAAKRSRRSTAAQETPAQRHEPVEPETVASALHAIPVDVADGYDAWVAVGMAVKDALGASGFDLWDRWSSRSDKYKPDEMADKWSSFKSNGVTAGSLFKLAKDYGWQPPVYTIRDFERDVQGWVAAKTKEAEAGGFPTILAAEVEPRQLEWLIEGAMATGQCGFAAGHPGTFKSWAMAEMMIAVASGRKAFGTLSVIQGPVLAFNAEDDPAIITRARLDRLARGGGDDLKNLPIYLVDVDTLRLDNPEHVGRLAMSVQQVNAKLLVLDPLRNLHWAQEDSSTEMTPILAGVRSIQHATGCTVLLVHHDRKGGGDGRRESRVRGSNSLEGWRDFAMYFDVACEGCVTVTPYVKGSSSPPCWTFSVMDLPDGTAQVITTSEGEMVEEKITTLLRQNPDGVTREGICGEMKGRKTTVLHAIRDLVRRGYAIETSSKTRGVDGKLYPTTLVQWTGHA